MFNFNRILKFVDLAKTDDSSLAQCLLLASKFDSEVHLLHVVAENAMPLFGSQRRLTQSTEQLAALPLPKNSIRVKREVREGTMTNCALEYAKEHEIDLVFIDRSDLRLMDRRSANALVRELRMRLSIPIILTDSVGWLEQSNNDHAMKSLIEKFGSELAGDQQATLESLVRALEDELRLSREQAEGIVAKAQECEWLKWKMAEGGADFTSPLGCWKIRQPNQPESSGLTLVEDEFDMERTAAVSLIQRAIEVNATDIHIDPDSSQGYNVQFRIDGRMHQFCRMQQHVAGVTMKQIKLMANLSLADPFQPSESRLEMPVSLPHYDVRVTTAPVANGEAIAMRIIDGKKLGLPLSEIGLSETSFESVHRMLHHCSGIVLIAGPTGAGKTTTAYSILNLLFSNQQKIVSIEDPVEMVVPFMRQLNVDAKHKFTMRNGLSTILRMDPDAIFIGEIRDAEAAQIALQAAASGKRAVSTIHLKDVAATVSAMKEFDVDGKTLADSIAGVIAQRLVRRLCLECREFSPLTQQEKDWFKSQKIDLPTQLARASGCPACRGTGYKGRIGVFEAVVVEGEFAEAVRQEAHVSDLRRFVFNSGASLLFDGLTKVRDGITTIEELQEASWLDEGHPPLDPTDSDKELYKHGKVSEPMGTA